MASRRQVRPFGSSANGVTRMKIFKWWKIIEIMPGITFEVARGEIASDHSFFNQTVAAIKDKTDMDYMLLERTEAVADYRGGE